MQQIRSDRTVVGENIRVRRLELGWTRRTLARNIDGQAGFSPTEASVYRWEAGTTLPSEPYLLALARALDRDPGWFYTDHGRRDVA